MGQKRQKLLRLWAITLFFSGILSFIQLTRASFTGSPASRATLNSSFSAFVFPNPLRTSIRPTLVVEPGSSEKITARIYDPSGSLVYQTRVDDRALSSTSNALTYEVPIETNFKPGVYVGVVLGYQDNAVSDRSVVRFSVVR